MKKTDMELQAIREKLRSLQVDPAAAEALPMPWSQPKPLGITHPQRSEYSGENRQVQHAIEALQQRSRSQDLADPARVEELIAHELQRLEAQAHNINVRSQQQAADLIALKRSAQQGTLALARQGIHDHPKLKAITEFFNSYQSAVVPRIDIDTTGHFTLSYTTVEFEQAEQAAEDVAQSLRQRPSSNLFRHPIESSDAGISRQGKRPDQAEPALAVYSAVFESKWLQAAIERVASRFHRLQKVGRHSSPNAMRAESQDDTLSPVRPDADEQPVSDGYSNDQYSSLDDAIWFCGAAIALIAIKATPVSDSLLRTSVIAALFGVIGFALFQVVYSKSSDYSLSYRLFIAMSGLFLASFMTGLF
ncbi:MAG: hypothetical protein WBB01_03965 [Phormidesmis sp.]